MNVNVTIELLPTFRLNFSCQQSHSQLDVKFKESPRNFDFFFMWAMLPCQSKVETVNFVQKVGSFFWKFLPNNEKCYKIRIDFIKNSIFLCILPPMCRQDDSFITFFRFERYHLLNRVGNRSFVFENVSSDTSVHE